jgi:hypothetical protein
MSFLVEFRHWMLNGSITSQVREKLGVGENRLVPAFGYNSKILQIFYECFVTANGQNHSRSDAKLIGEILQGLAHAVKIRSS